MHARVSSKLDCADIGEFCLDGASHTQVRGLVLKNRAVYFCVYAVQDRRLYLEHCLEQSGKRFAFV